MRPRSLSLAPASLLVSLFLLLLLLLLFGPAGVRAACYNLDGSDATDSSYQPCNASAEVSACCANNKGASSDICMSSGLCYAQMEGYRGLIYMNGCTDKTGLSSDCPHICPDATSNWDGGSSVQAWNVLQCGKGVYCCRPDTDMTTNCCSNSSAVITTDIGTLLLATATATVGSGTAASTVTITAVAGGAAATTSSSSTNGTSEVANCPADKTAVVGGAVGGALGAALIASLGALVFLLLRRKRASAPYVQQEYSTNRAPVYMADPSKPPYSGELYVQPTELPVSQRTEMM
ncbi:hypothetical protein M406DRAFT_72612 [Cryphonectria parasitica EP155]|uniref:Mid2 domain-containing protein n=1 Tax=Cryphonectria parasitica (strain ATCC 38755 / EP155) TaxID=660469 RepID=A0A9P4XX57_CRYP1|nr:uncharacterized protein M406DRAFT_72612 [Cryphonectria parasitica EP155]KAF3762628.1 hypothetical protein M406DRAFT_72612 [Cryphonectria parasitica EP155]